MPILSIVVSRSLLPIIVPCYCYSIGVLNKKIIVSQLFIVRRLDICIFMFFFVCKLLQLIIHTY